MRLFDLISKYAKAESLLAKAIQERERDAQIDLWVTQDSLKALARTNRNLSNVLRFGFVYDKNFYQETTNQFFHHGTITKLLQKEDSPAVAVLHSKLASFQELVRDTQAYLSTSMTLLRRQTQTTDIPKIKSYEEELKNNLQKFAQHIISRYRNLFNEVLGMTAEHHKPGEPRYIVDEQTFYAGNFYIFLKAFTAISAYVELVEKTADSSQAEEKSKELIQLKIKQKIVLLEKDQPIIFRFCSIKELKDILRTGRLVFGPCGRTDSFQKLLSLRRSVWRDPDMVGGYAALAQFNLGTDRGFTRAADFSSKVTDALKKLRRETTGQKVFYEKAQSVIRTLVQSKTNIRPRLLEEQNIAKLFNNEENNILNRFFNEDDFIAKNPQTLRLIITALTKFANICPAKGIVNPYGKWDIDHYQGYEVILLIRSDAPTHRSEELFVTEAPVSEFLLGVGLMIPLRNYADSVATTVMTAASKRPEVSVPVYDFDGKLHWPRN